jgi:hypothetical protein
MVRSLIAVGLIKLAKKFCRYGDCYDNLVLAERNAYDELYYENYRWPE